MESAPRKFGARAPPASSLRSSQPRVSRPAKLPALPAKSVSTAEAKSPSATKRTVAGQHTRPARKQLQMPPMEGLSIARQAQLALKAGYKSKYDPKTVLMLRDYFVGLDSDRDGIVSRKEFRTSYERAKKGADTTGYMPFFSESFFDMIDRDGSEGITFAEMLRCIFPLATKSERDNMMSLAFPKNANTPNQARQLTNEQLQEITEIFRMYDKDCSGALSIEELRIVSMNSGMTKVEVERLMGELDKDSDGTVTLEEFIEGMKSTYMEQAKNAPQPNLSAQVSGKSMPSSADET